MPGGCHPGGDNGVGLRRTVFVAGEVLARHGDVTRGEDGVERGVGEGRWAWRERCGP